MTDQSSFQLPKKGLSKKEILESLEARKSEDKQWKNGKAFALVYYPGDAYADAIKSAYLTYFSENALNPTAFPSLRQLEGEVVQIATNLLNGGQDACGSLTTGGTESILLAIHTAREYAKKHKPDITEPEVIVPTSAHPAFIKACHYFDVKYVLAPLDRDFRVDMEAVERLISPNTIMLVGSAPCYPYGLIDPITDLSDLAVSKGLLLHVDACVGGFILPFARKLGYPILDFDFRLEGVTSISADIHKYGYAAKGASLIMYKNHELRKHQFFVYTDWVGGIYGSPTMTGTRPGGAIAAAWTALNVIGWDGYLDMAKKTMDTTMKIREAVEAIPEIELVGDPDVCLLALASDQLDIFTVADELGLKGWHFDRQSDPNSIHLTISNGHERVVDEFVHDLREAVKKAAKPTLRKAAAKVQIGAVKGLHRLMPEGTIANLNSRFSGPGAISGSKRSAAMYGMMGALAGSGDIDEIVLDLLDKLNGLEQQAAAEQ